MMMRQRMKSGFVLVALIGVFCLGLSASRLAWQPFQVLGQLFHNPLGIVTRVAPSGPVVLERVQRLSRLESCRYNGEVIIKASSAGALPAWLVGDRLLFVGRGEVVGGIDLSKVRADDVQVQENCVSVRLPAAEILSTSLRNRDSEVFARTTGLLNKPNKDLETQVRVEAEDRLRQAALSSGVLQTASQNAEEALRAQLRMLGFQEIHFL
jgi:hypothetical protein